METITRKACHYCIWYQKELGSLLATCKWHHKSLLEIFWNKPEVTCEHYEQWHEQL